MLLLAFDTATPAITVAVHDGESVIGASDGSGAMAHGELLAPAIAEAMSAAGATMAQLTDVAVGVGPGPYTGLRVGVVTAVTLAHALGLRSHGVCTLDILAHDVETESEFVVATDARRKEVYWARYDASRKRVGEPAVGRPETVAELGLPVVGRGGQLYSTVLRSVDGPIDPAASALAHLVVSSRFAALPLRPLYLRRPDATANYVAKLA